MTKDQSPVNDAMTNQESRIRMNPETPNQNMENDEVVPLAYAPDREGAALLLVYQCVGWYVLVTAVLTMIQPMITVFTLPGTGASLAIPSIWVLSLPALLVCAAAVPMILGHVSGAWWLAGAIVLRVLIGIAAMFLSGASFNAGVNYRAGVITTQLLYAAVNCFLPLIVWKVCRDNGVFERAS